MNPIELYEQQSYRIDKNISIFTEDSDESSDTEEDEIKQEIFKPEQSEPEQEPEPEQYDSTSGSGSDEPEPEPIPDIIPDITTLFISDDINVIDDEIPPPVSEEKPKHNVEPLIINEINKETIIFNHFNEIKDQRGMSNKKFRF